MRKRQVGGQAAFIIMSLPRSTSYFFVLVASKIRDKTRLNETELQSFLASGLVIVPKNKEGRTVDEAVFSANFICSRVIDSPKGTTGLAFSY